MYVYIYIYIHIYVLTRKKCMWIDRGSEREHSQRFWTLDPIDGTKGFLRRQQYAVPSAAILY
jgi:3'-phosphoadenosine 5'-phosphosulfate (PAPS) 3'-phosphatase